MAKNNQTSAAPATTPRGQRAAAKRLGAGGTAERDKLAAGDRDGETKEE